MASFSESSNIHNTILEILSEKGYQVWIDKDSNSYCAEKHGWDFMANSLAGLLGLISVYEHQNPSEFKEYWWKREGPLTEDTLPLFPCKYEPIWKK